jgi:hypothetical protein
MTISSVIFGKKLLDTFDSNSRNIPENWNDPTPTLNVEIILIINEDDVEIILNKDDAGTLDRWKYNNKYNRMIGMLERTLERWIDGECWNGRWNEWNDYNK